jgi:hypothetical protein
MINPGIGKYEVVLADRYYLRELIESITLEESLDDIAYHADVKLLVTDDFPTITPGQDIRVSGVPFGENIMKYLLRPGVVWECCSTSRGQKHLNVTVYDKTIYLSRSEDEYLFPAGQTATQRLKKYASDWDITLVPGMADTKSSLAKAVYRFQSIYSMIKADLTETVQKNGEMYRARMTPNGIELYSIGSNATVWALETEQNLEEINQCRTLEGAVTRVKVLGNAPEDKRSPVLALVEGDTKKLGTLQKVLTDSKITNAGQAKTAGQRLLAGIQETVTVRGLDINTIRAGDKVNLNGWDLLVMSVKHELGSPGHMTLELAGAELVRRRYFNGPF